MDFETYCSRFFELDGTTPVQDWSQDLPESSQRFIQSLGLPLVHPFCQDGVSSQQQQWMLSDIPPMGPLQHSVHVNMWEAIVTWCYATIPPYMAFVELWVRLMSGLLAPLGLLWLIREEQLVQQQQKQSYPPSPKMSFDNGCENDTEKSTRNWVFSIITVATVLSSLLIMTDSNYVYEYGTYGVSLFVFSWGLSFRACWLRSKHVQDGKAFRYTRLTLISLALFALILTWDWRSCQFQLGVPEEVNVRVPSGLHYNHNNPLIRLAIEQYWPKRKWTYEPSTRWMPTGDARTGLPYFFNSVPNVNQLDWKHVYLTVSDGEVLDLAIVFPQTGHNTSQPIYLILHGVNGGITDGYIRDFAVRRTSAGSTVVVMISRGLMDTPLRGWNLFHGARWSDAHDAAVALRRAMPRDQILGGVGYSMGAIVLANYVASSGSDCALDAAFAVSGALECRHEQNYTRAQRLWQPMIASFLRDNHYQAKFAQRIHARLSRPQMLGFLRATHCVRLDEFTSAAYNGYPSLEDFYSDMGALGDIPVLELGRVSNFTRRPKIHNVHIPFGVLHAFDDPISTWRTVAANEGILHPHNLVQTGDGNIVVLLTDKGGHVGWPLGMYPFRRNWEFMNEAASSFVEAVAQAKSDLGIVTAREPSRQWLVSPADDCAVS